MEAEEDDHGEGHALDDDPHHRTEHLGFDGARAHVLYRVRKEDVPLEMEKPSSSQVEEGQAINSAAA